LITTSHYRVIVLWIFLLWIIVFIGIFWRQRWTLPLGLIGLVATVVFLKMNMDSTIPLNF